MTDIAANINKVYTANNDSALMSQVSKAVCILLPGSFTLAGYNDKGVVLVINQYSNIGKPWEPDYLQEQLQNKSLQSLFKKVAAVFVGYDKHLLVPKQLYNQAEAEQWMRKLHFVEADEVVMHTRLRDDKTWMLHTLPLSLTYLLENKFPKAKVLPLAAYQFYKNMNGSLVECCITDKDVYATCYIDKQLVWHQVFDYQSAEDIAYKFRLMLQEQNTVGEELGLRCSVCSPQLSNVVKDLKAYFPKLTDGEGAEREWRESLYLLSQVYKCV